MPLSHVFVVYLIQLLLLVLPAPGAAKMFEKAGVPGWKAYVPFYNTWIMQELAQRPRHWVFWQLIPVVGWFITPGIYIEFVKLFGRFGFIDHTLASLFAPLYFPYLGYSDKVRYIGPEGVKRYEKPGWREWVDAAIFAIVAATLIRTFIFEAYTIPSGSMEKTLLVNDFLFVSKFSYGPRIPNTPLSVPFVHNYLPGTPNKSYTTAVQLPYIRWFASDVERGDVVVFNFPAGDTVINLPDFQSQRPYYDFAREIGGGDMAKGRQMILSNPEIYPIAVHPPDKSDNYIKRCVGIYGDTLEVKNNTVWVNGRQMESPPRSVIHYTVVTNGQSIDPEVMKEEYDVDVDRGELQQGAQPFVYYMALSDESRKKLEKIGYKVFPTQNIPAAGVFPFDESYNWSRDNYGPVWIPARGATLKLTERNYPIYERAIRVYEKNEFEMRDGKFYLNGKETDSYTFKMNYYWMMGDNRQGSQDSRYWGFVPEDRIVGKAWLIWFSWENGPRWNRLFRVVK